MADTATRTYHFLVNKRHPAFRSITLTPADGLLTELAWMTAEYLKDERSPPPTSEILAGLRHTYGQEATLDPRQMQLNAIELLSLIGRAIISNCPEQERAALFDGLSVAEKEAVMRSLAAKQIRPTDVVGNGTFLLHGPVEVIAKFVQVYPEYCFDQKIWDEPYESLDYNSPGITAIAKAEMLARYRSLLDEVVWLSRQELHSALTRPREELIRASMSLQILRPDTEIT